MPRPIDVDIDLDDVDADGIAQLQALTANTAMTLNGALGTTLDYARQIEIYSASDINTIVFTVVGTDAKGDALSETITGVNAAAVESVGYYKTITSVTPDSTSASTARVGTVDEVASKLQVLNFYAENAATVSVDVTGTINFTVQETHHDVLGGVSPVWSNVSALASKTADTTAQLSLQATACRILVNSHSSGAELQMRIIQPR